MPRILVVGSSLSGASDRVRATVAEPSRVGSLRTRHHSTVNSQSYLLLTRSSSSREAWEERFVSRPNNNLPSYRHRSFSSRPRQRLSGRPNSGGQNRRSGNKQNSHSQLVNEDLVALLVRRFDTSPDKIQVRMIVTQEPTTSDDDEADSDKPTTTTEIVSLADAIQRSIDEDQDLIGIALTQEIPVVKIDNLKMLAYRHAKAEGKGKSSVEKNSKVLRDKEFQFGGAIADSDLQRKVDRLVEALREGRNCSVTIKCTFKHLRKDPQAARNGANRVLELLVGEENDYAVLVNDSIRVYGNDRLAQFTVRPSAKLKALSSLEES